MNEPVKVIETNEPGRPAFSDEQYLTWVNEMSPFLKTGNTLNYCIDKANLNAHRTVIFEKYKLNDWFSDKIDAMRSYPGEMVNKTIVNLVIGIHDKVLSDRPVDANDINLLKFFAEKHRSAQPFFVTRTETVNADPKKVGKILDNLDQTNYDELGSEAKKQILAPNPPVQDQGQKGPDSNVQT